MIMIKFFFFNSKISNFCNIFQIIGKTSWMYIKIKNFQKYLNFFVKETTKLIPKKTHWLHDRFLNILVIKM
jgi:hypothetical protein